MFIARELLMYLLCYWNKDFSNSAVDTNAEDLFTETVVLNFHIDS